MMLFSPTRRWRAAVLAVVAVVAFVPAWPQSDAGSLLRQADEYARAGHFDEARAAYESALRSGASLEADALRSRLLAECYVNSSPQDLSAAVRWFRNALRLENSPGVRADLAETLMRAGAYDAAAEQYQELAAAQPESSPYWISLSSALLHGGKPEAALKALKSALDHVSSQTVIRLEYARVLAYQKQFTAAREQYETVLRSEPGNLIAQVGVAKVTSWQGDQEAALVMYDRILQRAPSLYDAQVGKAFTLLWMGRQQEALAILEPAARRHPEDADVRQALERLRPGAGRNPDAAHPPPPISFRLPLAPAIPTPPASAQPPAGAATGRVVPLPAPPAQGGQHSTRAHGAVSKARGAIHAALADAADRWASDMSPPQPPPPERIPLPWKIAGGVAAGLAVMQLIVLARRPRIIIQTVREVPAWERRMATLHTRGALSGHCEEGVILDATPVEAAEPPPPTTIAETAEPPNSETPMAAEPASEPPSSSAAPGAPAETSTPPAEERAHGPMEGTRILVIGSQAAVVEMQRRVLTGAGATVATDDHLSPGARDGFGGFDLVVLNDHTVDHLRPQTVYRWVAERRPEWTTKLLIVFSAEDDGTRQFVGTCGARCVFQPFGATELLSHVREALAARVAPVSPPVATPASVEI